MSRLVKILSCCAFIFAPSLVASCACDGDDPNPTSTTGIAGSGGVGGTSNSAGHGGIAGSGGVGGTVAPNPWGNGPGRPGAVTALVRDIPLVQGMSSQNQLLTRGTTNKCTGEGGSAGAGGSAVGGAGGIGGSVPVGGNGGAGELPWCPTDYTPLQPTLDLSGIDKTSIQLAFPTTPVFQPFDNDVGCPTARQPIDVGRVFTGDCTGSLSGIPVFTEGDLSGFFGSNETTFQINTNLVIEGRRVSILTGLAVKSAICGDRLYIVSNGSSTLIEVELMQDGGFARTDHDVGEPGLSGLVCAPDGSVLFSSSRVFTVDWWNTAGGAEDPSLLIEDRPIRIHRFSPTTQTISLFAEISGGSVVQTQGFIPVDVNGEGETLTLYMGGTVNVLALASDEGILFGDHLTGEVWRFSADGQTRDLLFSTDRLFTGLVQAPNGVMYLALNAKAYMDCTPQSKVVMAYYDPQADLVTDWMMLDDPAYDEMIPMLCYSGVIENDVQNDTRYLGGGNFNDLAVDLEGNLYVTETILNRTTAIHVVFDEPDAGVGGAGGVAGAGGATATGGASAGTGGL